VGRELVLTERPREEPARIFASLEIEDEGAFELCLDE